MGSPINREPCLRQWNHMCYWALGVQCGPATTGPQLYFSAIGSTNSLQLVGMLEPETLRQLRNQKTCINLLPSYTSVSGQKERFSSHRRHGSWSEYLLVKNFDGKNIRIDIEEQIGEAR